MPFDKEKLDLILDEIVKYQVDLVEDPTLPEYGTRYLQRIVAQCRNFLNRTQFYIQSVGKHEKELRINMSHKEMDINLKFNSLLAEDPDVRKQPSITDRQALANTMLSDDNNELSRLKLDLLDTQETLKLIKMKYGDLQKTNNDIKMQRQLIKDDKDGWMDGSGYTPPTISGKVPDGMSPPVLCKSINPTDVLDPNKRPEDLPEPRDKTHAEQISAFFNSPLKSHADLPKKYNGLFCKTCDSPQFFSLSGITCSNGHGGESGVERNDGPVSDAVSYADLLKI
jgi:hypothetical protein